MIPRHGSWQVADQRTQQRRKGTHYVSTCLCALALYLIHVKPVLPHGGGIMAIYHCVVIHSAFELGLLAAKLRYIYEMTKGMGKFFWREVGDGNVKMDGI